MLLDLKTLKQELEFERKLERSAPPQGAEAGARAGRVAEPAVRVSPSRARTNGEPAPTRTALVSGAEYIFGGIRRHKLGVAIALALLVAAGLGVAYFRQPFVAKVPIESVAVLPFENVTHDQHTEYLSDGVTESLINSLSQLPHIKVIARSSVFRYKNQTPDLQQVARQLNVQAVLTGRVLAQGDTLSVSVEMTDTLVNVDVCLPYYLARQYDQSIAQARKAIEMFPNFFLPHLGLGQALLQKGDYSTGIEEIEKAKAMEPTPFVIGALGYAYAKAGRKDEALKVLAELKEQSKRRYVASYWIAVIHAGLGEKDEAFAWLEKAYQEHSWFLVWIKMDPQLDSLCSDARFTDLMRRVGFP